ncbi:MAG: hypothetical protein EHM36_08170, partial [Deltaproteobacteria bacterium]
GTVSAVNHEVEASPNLVWKDSYGRGWLVIIQPDHPEAVFNLYSGHRAKEWFTRSAENFSNLLIDWAPNPSRGKKSETGVPVPEKVREHWDEITRILFG